MQKVGKVKIYDSWNGVITSVNKEYRFRKDDIVNGEVAIGDEVNFVSELYPHYQNDNQILTARFVKKKELSKR